MGGVLTALLLLTNCRPTPALEITFGGDIMLGREGQALFQENPWAEFAVKSGDEKLFFANLESPLTDSAHKSETQGYDLCADAKQVKILSAGGIDLVTTANNHQADCVDAESTGLILERASIKSVNAQTSPFFMSTSGGVIGVLAFDAVAKPLDFEAVLVQVDAARPNCEFLIVSLHWGFEYAVEPSQTQREWAQKLSDAGVDVLWGHHPHVLQPVEWVKASQDDHHMLTMYSLGNLLADQWMTWDTQYSALLTLRLSGTDIKTVSVRPIHMDPATKKLIAPSLESIERIEKRLPIPSEIVDSPPRP